MHDHAQLMSEILRKYALLADCGFFVISGHCTGDAFRDRNGKERQRSLECFARVLMFQNTHYLRTLRLDTVVDRMRAAHATVIARSNMVNRWI